MRMKWLQFFCTVFVVCLLTACGNEKPHVSQSGTDRQEQTRVETSNIEAEITEEDTQTSGTNTDVEGNVMKIAVGKTTFTVALEDNSSVEALKEILMEGPLTINMSDYGNMEKVGSIGTSLPENNEQITTVPGDIILYQGTSLVIYYDTNSWNFTRLGRINDVTQEELKEALGKGDVMVTLTLGQ